MPGQRLIHAPGLIYAALAAFLAFAAMNTQNNLLFWVFGIMISGLAVSWLVAWLTIRRLSIRRVDPRYGVIGEPLIVNYAARNLSRWMSIFNVQVSEAPSADHRRWNRVMQAAIAWIMHVGPNETVHGEAVFWPDKRGVLAFSKMRVWTSFPFGILRFSRTIRQPQYTLIYPKVYELRKGLLRNNTTQGMLGSRISAHAGAGDDYYGMREYRLGDSMRHIAWKRTAKSDDLVTIERANPSPSRLRVVLDLSLRSSHGKPDPAAIELQRDLEERAISLAASVLHAGEAEGFEIGLTILGFSRAAGKSTRNGADSGENAHYLPLRRNRWHFHKLLAALARIELDADRSGPARLDVPDAERAIHVVVAADRVEPIDALPDAIYLTGRQLDSLAIRPIGLIAPTLQDAQRGLAMQEAAA